MARATRKKGNAQKALKPLNHQEQRFVEEYLVHLRPRAAAIAAGYAVTTAETKACLWVSSPALKPHVFAAIQKAMEERSKELNIQASDVLRMWWDIAQADPRELVKYKRGACRNCWGEGFTHQFVDQAEYAVSLMLAANGKGPMPPENPTFGFNPNKQPNPKCPHCWGDGMGKVVVSDTSKLSASAAMIYEGVQVGKEGIKVNMRSRSDALLNIAKHIGMLTPKIPGDGEKNPLHVLFQQIAGNALGPVEEDPDYLGDETED